MMYGYVVRMENAACGTFYAESLPLFDSARSAERAARKFCRTMKAPEPRYIGRAEDGRAHIVITKDGEPC